MEIEITIRYDRDTICQPEKELLSQLLGLPTTCVNVKKVAETPEAKTEKPQEEPKTDVKEAPQDTETQNAVESTTEVSLDDLRALCVEKAKTNRGRLVEILGKFGAKSVFELKKEDYNNFAEIIKAL